VQECQNSRLSAREPEPYPPPRLELRVAGLEDNMSDVGTSIARLAATTERLNGRIGRP